MSNFLAIATVTASLADLLRRAVQEDVPGAEVKIERPEDLENGLAQPTVNLYLFQTTLNGAFRCADLPTRNSEGQVVQRPQAALDLHYLLTFFGDENQLEPQRLLGSVVRTLHAHPVLTHNDIVGAIAAVTGGNPDHFLNNSNLAEQTERVKFSPIVLNLEELSKLWSVFFQTAYRLSIAYQASVVLIEGKETPRAGLPVLERNVPGKDMPPAIDKILSQKDLQSDPRENQPIVADDILVLAGQRLRRDHTFVRFNTRMIPADKFVEFNATQIKIKLDAVTLGDQLQTGRHSVQVVHALQFIVNGELHNVLESNSVFFTLRPELASVEVVE